MIDKHTVARIIKLVKKYKIKGHAFCYGDQKCSFSKEWLRGKNEKEITPMKTEDFFKYLGFEKYTDIDYNANAKLDYDLGKPIPKSLYNSADFIFDGGTIEHIPDVFQALSNAANLVKKGGIIFHAVPTSCYGEAYYNIDPLLLMDFYRKNDFELIECVLYYNKLKLFDKIKYYIVVNLPKNLFLKIEKIYHKRIEKTISNSSKPYFSSEKEPIYIDVLDPRTKLKIKISGYYPGTHVIYIGRKMKDNNKIKIPIQEVYPNRI